MNRLFNLFANYDNFTQFSTEAWISGNVRNADSLESLHDVIHSITGMNGQMTYLDYSAFDPIFWLHHTMLDRCFALWQAVNDYEGHVQPARAATETFTIAEGEMVDEQTRKRDCMRKREVWLMRYSTYSVSHGRRWQGVYI